jgi:N-methylhydantoinase B
VRAGQVIRIRTTGGGGWGDPLDRAVADVVRDVEWRKVSVAAARDDYGVVLTLDDATATVDHDATEGRRTELRAARTGDEPFFDRGPGYARLSGGATHADVDVL